MAVTANSVLTYNEGRLAIAKGTIDLSATTAGRFKAMLIDGDYVPAASDTAVTAGFTSNEVSSTGTGYTAGGIALTGVTCVIGSGAAANKAVFSSAAISMTVGATGFSYRYVAIKDTTTNKLLFVLDYGVRTANPGDQITVTPDATSGWATV